MILLGGQSYSYFNMNRTPLSGQSRVHPPPPNVATKEREELSGPKIANVHSAPFFKVNRPLSIFRILNWSPDSQVEKNLFILQGLNLPNPFKNEFDEMRQHEFSFSSGLDADYTPYDDSVQVVKHQPRVGYFK